LCFSQDIAMSIDHSHVIANDGNIELKVNISGLNESNRDINSLSAYMYATGAKSGESKFTCSLSMSQLAGLYSYLDQYEMIKDISKGGSGEFISVKNGQKEKELVALLSSSDHDQVIPALQTIIKDNLSNDDINIILGRKDAIKEFERWLSNLGEHTEPEWQAFLEKNEWIFGYGLRYRYLAILQRECHVSGTDLDGKNSVISDFLVSDTRFTKLVELKRPDTPLFKSGKNRSEAWQLSGELTDAVSQILCQKAHWELASQSNCYKSDGNKITESTYDVDCILLIGTSEQFSGDDKESDIKRKTIELYRRNMRNIEIIFFDELLDRARFIVEGSN